jgi:sugar/nucleoside kinase (ribokinase family)
MALNKIEVVGIGSPFVDYIIEVPYEFLMHLEGAKGGMEIVDHDTLEKILKRTGSVPKLLTGGSCANAIRGLAKLGHHTALIGRIGRDNAGRSLLEHFQELKITSHLTEANTPTAQVACLITPDGERTMRAFLGASQEMSESDLKESYFAGTSLVHIEGYTILKGSLAKKSMEMAKAAGVKVSYDLGSFEVVGSYKEELIKLLSSYVNILFANEDEVFALTQLGPEKGCKVLSDLCETVVVLLGDEGCLVSQGKKVIHVPAKKVHAIDTTGAGDLFASGFLHGYLKGKSLEESAYFGTLAGAAVVQVSGVEIPIESWKELRQEIKEGKAF